MEYKEIKNHYIETVEKLIKEGKLFIITETDNKGRIGGSKIITAGDNTAIVRFLVKQELNKIPKWVRKLWKIH